MCNSNTLFVGKVLLHFPSLSSTNDYALDLLSKSKPGEGTVISADYQTGGKGQIGSSWESEPGQNITLSAILYPSFLQARQQFSLNQAIALAVRDCVARYVENQVSVKWPNDVYIGDSKTAGILIQNTIAGAVLQSSVVGIGINVNQTVFPPALSRATSLRLARAGRPVDLDELRSVLFSCIEVRYLALRALQFDILREDYYAHLYRYRQLSTFRTADGRILEGQIVGVDAIGRLLVEHPGATEAFYLKEIAFIENDEVV